MKNYAMYFSPTGGTEKVVKTIAERVGTYTEIDLTERNMDKLIFEKGDVCIIGVPSFGGRVPQTALERMEDFKGNLAVAVPVVVYGNRDYDDTFVELRDFLVNKGFSCAAAVAAVAEHSIMHQFATGRPDKEDMEQLEDYADKIKELLESGESFEEPELPGNRPYKEYKGLPLNPNINSKCTNCGLCAEKCPVEAIAATNFFKTDTDKCISCMRCISICPNKARSLNSLMVNAAALKMKKVCSERKDNRLFIGKSK